MMRVEERKWARKSFLISLVIHGMIFVFLAVYVVGVSTKVQEIVKTVFVSELKPQKYEPRPKPVKPVTNPSLPRARILDDFVPVASLTRSSPASGRSAKTTALLRVPDGSPVQNVASPSSLAKNRILPYATTAAKVPPADLSLPPSSVSGGASSGLDSGGRLGTGGGGLGAGGRGRSTIGSAVISPTAPDRQPLSMTRASAATSAEDGLTDVAKGVTLGPSRVPPLSKGKPGGIAIGRGKDIEGHIRFARIKHYLADWWADPSAMPGVIYWLNTQTKVRADMNIEGGALTLDDPKLMECPLAIMTGHDRTILTPRLRGNYRHNLADSERTGLRKYLIEAGGLLFFDECGHDLMLFNQIKNELRAALPEYSTEWIPNKHELYSCFYPLGGAPPGAYRFWKHGGGRNKVGKHLYGLFINDRLAAVLSDHDYLCAARTERVPGHGYTGEESLASYRFLTNLIVYSLTHGGISNHSDYVPEMTDKDRISIDAPIQVPILLPE